jgi:transcriptional regulator with XRE-family HTH domain
MASITLSAYGDLEALRAVGESLRHDRLCRNFTQKHVAALAGISLPTYRKLEQGDGSVEIGHFARVVAILGHIQRLADLIPPVQPPFDRKIAMAMFSRERARSREPRRR